MRDVIFDDYSSKVDLRVTTIHRVCDWMGDTSMSDDSFEQSRRQISKLLGFPNWAALKLSHRSETDGAIGRHLENLNGPNGYTYYRMLLAQRGQSDDE